MGLRTRALLFVLAIAGGAYLLSFAGCIDGATPNCADAGTACDPSLDFGSSVLPDAASDAPPSDAGIDSGVDAPDDTGTVDAPTE
jgi:hypothetical protein